jgi:hypothetical protein
MALKSYVLVQNYRAPYVVATGHPRNPQQIKTKMFKEGEIVRGELKHANNQPAFILVAGTLPIPVDYIKELTTKAIVEDDKIVPAEVIEETKTEEVVVKTDKPTSKMTLKSSNPKVKYMDAVIIGGLAGLVAVWGMGKQGWIGEVDKKHYLYGGLIGGVLGAYLVYRFTPTKATPKISKKKKDSEEE